MKIESNINTRLTTDYFNKPTTADAEIKDANQPSIEDTDNKNNLTQQERDMLPVSEKSFIDAIEKANKIMINHNTRAEFSVHEVTKDIMIKIIDTDTNQVIREVPPKKILDVIAKIWEMAGLVVDERR